MRPIETIVALAFPVIVAGPANAQGIDWQKVDGALGKTGAVSGEVHRYGFPRSDLQVSVDGVSIRPTLALGGWVAFEPVHGALHQGFDNVLIEPCRHDGEPALRRG